MRTLLVIAIFGVSVVVCEIITVKMCITLTLIFRVIIIIILRNRCGVVEPPKSVDRMLYPTVHEPETPNPPPVDVPRCSVDDPLVRVHSILGLCSRCTLMALCRAIWAGLSSGRRRTWPNSECLLPASGLRSNVNMPIKRPHATSYVLAIALFTLSVTICEIFTFKMCMLWPWSLEWANDKCKYAN